MEENGFSLSPDCYLDKDNISELNLYQSGAKFVFTIEPREDSTFEAILPGNFAENSIRPLNYEDVDGNIRIERRSISQWIPEKLKDLDLQLHEQKKIYKGLKVRKTALEQTIALLKDYQSSTSNYSELKPQEILNYIKEAQELRFNSESELSETNHAIVQAAEKINILDTELKARKPDDKKTCIIVSGRADKPVKFEAFTSAASWKLSYVMDLDSKTGDIQAKLLVSVSQKTGLDFSEKIKFHTSEYHLNILDNVCIDGFVTGDGKESIITENVVLKSTIEILSEQQTTYDHPNIIAHIDNTSLNLNAGSVELRIDGEKSAATDIIERQKLISFGSIKDITFMKEALPAKKNAKILNDLDLYPSFYTSGYKLKITNYTNDSKIITVKDCIPVINDENVRFKLINIEPEPLLQEYDNKFTWEIEVPAKETAVITVDYVFEDIIEALDFYPSGAKFTFIVEPRGDSTFKAVLPQVFDRNSITVLNPDDIDGSISIENSFPAYFVVSGKSYGPGPVKFEAFTSAASWNLSYMMDLDSQTGDVNVQMYIKAMQQTGFNFNGKINFHTRMDVDTCNVLTVPSLDPMRIEIKPKAERPEIVAASKAHDVSYAPDIVPFDECREEIITDPDLFPSRRVMEIRPSSGVLYASKRVTLPEPAKPEKKFPSIKETLLDKCITVDGTITGDGKEANIRSSVVLKSTPELVLIPEQRSNAWIIANMSDTNEKLIPGLAELRLDGQTSGKIHLDEFNQREIPFGYVDKITIRKEALFNNNRAETFRGLSTSGYRLENSNNTNEQKTVTVRECLPLSNDPKITLDIKSIEPAESERDSENRLTWKIEVPAGGKRYITVDYTLSYPDIFNMI